MPHAVLADRADSVLTRPQFARLADVSERTLAEVEAKGAAPPRVRRRLTELRRLTDALSDAVDPAVLGGWLFEPNDAFEGLKPAEVIERGEADRLWRMVHLLGSGTPG